MTNCRKWLRADDRRKLARRVMMTAALILIGFGLAMLLEMAGR